MFGLLKKKISSFIGSLSKKEEEKDEPEQSQEHATNVPFIKEKPASDHTPKKTDIPTTQKPVDTPQPLQEPPTRTKTPAIPKPVELLKEKKTESQTPFKQTTETKPIHKSHATAQPTPTPEQKKPEHTPTPKPGFLDALFGRKQTHTPPQKSTLPIHPPEQKSKSTGNQIEQSQPKTDDKKQKTQEPNPAITPAAPTALEKKDEAKKERKLEAKLGFVTKVKGFFVKEVTIQQNELDPMLQELNLALLESDVTLDTADFITTTLKKELSGKKVEKTQVQKEIQNAVKNVLTELVDQQPLNVSEFIQTHEKPVKILFLGPNGAGKTTTIAKIASHLKNQGLTCVLAAADTFRAAAIEQLAHHGEKIGVTVIQHQYGSDPSAVAFDAIAHAKARNIDCVLIDTAGRQETNLNLLKEMEKINRVIKPDLKLFIGEAVAGHFLVEQAKAFHAQVKIDGVVLTKVDCDAKGGTSFSIAHEVGVPIVFIGTGQEYGDIKPFDPKWLVSSVLAE